MKILSTLVATGLLFTFPSHALAGDGKVQYADLRDKEQAVIDAAPIAASNEKTAIIAYGGPDEALRAVYIAAGEIEKTTDEDIFFLQAPDRDGDPTKTVFEVYTRGVRTGAIVIGENLPAQADVEADFKGMVFRGLERVKAAQQ